MAENYCRETFTGIASNVLDLFWGLDTKIEPIFVVGQGNVFFISGFCFHKIYKIKKILLHMNNCGYKINHMNIARPELLKMFSHDLSTSENCRQSGFWCAIPINRLDYPVRTPIALEITLENNAVTTLTIGETVLSPSNDEFKLLKINTEKMVSRIKSDYSGPHVLICLATYNPDRELFKRQIRSIKNQTYKNWSCIINDDHSEISLCEWIARQVEDDDRFALFRNPENLGFYKNFEKLLGMVPENAEFVALSDQDDFWFADKIERLVNEFDDNTTLVYSDMRIVDKNGKILSETFWTTRENYYQDLDYLVLVNTITGAASIFRSSMIKYALPFPVSIGTSYHDHWIGCVANALGDIRYLDIPLYDYYQHRNVIGQAIFTNRSLYEKLRFLRNMHDISWIKRSLVFYQCVYNIDGIRTIIIATNLLLRIPHMNKAKRYSLSKFSCPGTSPLGLFMMIIRTIVNKKTTSDAEKYLFIALWADRVVRSRIIKNLV